MERELAPAAYAALMDAAKRCAKALNDGRALMEIDGCMLPDNSYTLDFGFGIDVVYCRGDFWEARDLNKLRDV